MCGARPWVRANTATAKAAAAAEVDDPGAMRVSHGASEKQRRDRINAMIDELRVIVPSGAAVVRAQVGPGKYCSRRHRKPFHSRHEGQSTCR